MAGVFFQVKCYLTDYKVCNLTSPTFNVGLELGLALGLDKEVILIASKRIKLPSDLIRQEVVFYGKDLEKLKSDFIIYFRNIK